MIGIDAITQLTGYRIGVFDVACPNCGPCRRSLINQRRKVLRVYRLESAFAGYHCARCGESGYATDGGTKPDPVKLAQARAEAIERERIAAAERLRKVRWLWSQRKSITGSIAETYLRFRGYTGTLPPTLAFLPPRRDHGPAMIAAFGFPTEGAPGELVIAAADVRGVHITQLAADGMRKAGTNRDKITIGRCPGVPIVLAPPNDLLGLAIAEGIEDALTVYDSTGLGAWAAGCGSRLSALASAVPNYVESVTLMVDDDDTGRCGCAELARGLRARGIETRSLQIGGAR